MQGDVKNWLFLAIAIALEVTATLSLRAAVDHIGWVALAVVGYAGAFVALAVLLRRGAPISVIYGIWSASGVALTAVLASVVFAEPLTLTIGAGIAIVIVGVVLVETGQPAADEPGPAGAAGAPAAGGHPDARSAAEGGER